MKLETLAWPEARSLGRESDRVFVVSLGSFEQHGRHLPMITDTAIITQIARRAESAAPDSVVLSPTPWIGHSPHHRASACNFDELAEGGTVGSPSCATSEKGGRFLDAATDATLTFRRGVFN